MGRGGALGCLVLLSVALVGAPVAGAVPESSPGTGSFERVTFEVAVHENGSARWTFRLERTLENATERRRFEAFADRFTGNETALYSDFRNQSRTLVTRGQRATGRNMTATDFARRAFVERGLNDVGVVEMSFTWTGFAATNGSRVIVGDVFEGGLYIGPDQSLVFAAGEGLRFAEVDPEGTASGPSLGSSDTVTWRGERTFADNHPRVVFVPVTETGSGAGTGTDAATPSDSGGESSDTGRDSPSTDARSGGLTGSPTPVTGTLVSSGSGPPISLLAAGFVAALAMGLGAAVLWRRREDAEVGTVDPAIGPDRDDGPAPEGVGETVSDPALMDDYERISALLDENDGRMRQSAIVEETGWSKSKVSMVLSEMDEDGEISKIRIGRENLISLPGYEPDAAGSPYDE